MSDSERYLQMADAVRFRDFQDWPGWSTGETLIVALLLNRADVLADMGWTMVEAFDRIDVSVVELRALERKVQS